MCSGLRHYFYFSYIECRLQPGVIINFLLTESFVRTFSQVWPPPAIRNVPSRSGAQGKTGAARQLFLDKKSIIRLSWNYYNIKELKK
jgi:hypothetical protein